MELADFIPAVAAFVAALVPVLLTGIKLHEKVSQINARVDALERQHYEHKGDMKGIHTEMKHLDDKMDKIGKDIVRIETDLKHISKQINDLKPTTR